MTFLQLAKTQPYEPYNTGLLQTAWGEHAEADPDWIASASFPDLLPYPNPKRTPDPYAHNPWNYFHVKSDWVEFMQLGHVLFELKFENLRTKLGGLDPWEFMYKDLIRFFREQTALNPFSRIVATYPVLYSGEVKLINSFHDLPSHDLHFKHVDPKQMFDAAFRCLAFLIQIYVSGCKAPPPPACPFKGCVEFARYKALDTSGGVLLACDKHKHDIQVDSHNGELRQMRTLKTWAMYRAGRAWKKGPTTQLSIEGVLK